MENRAEIATDVVSILQPRHFEIDHIIPSSKGGTDHLDNLQLLCGSCNRIKGSRSHEELMASLNDKHLIRLAA